MTLFPCSPWLFFLVPHLRGSRGVKLSESDLPFSCESSGNFWFSSLSQFSHTEKGMAVNFLLRTALRNQCFSFVFYWNPFDFQNSPQDCLQDREQTPQHRSSSKSDPTRTFQLHLSLLPLYTALQQNPSRLAPEHAEERRWQSFLCVCFFLLWWIGKTGAGEEQVSPIVCEIFLKY